MERSPIISKELFGNDSSLNSQNSFDCVDDKESLQGLLASNVKSLPEESLVPSMLGGNEKNKQAENPQINNMFNKGSMPPELLKEKYKNISEKKRNNGQTHSARHFQITQNHIENWDKTWDYLINLKQYHWCIATKETAPSTGHKHIHIYIQFKGAIRLSIKKLAGAHVEFLRGTPRQNIDYILKKKEPEKRGDIFYEEDKTEPWGVKNNDDEEAKEKMEDITYQQATEMNNEELALLPFTQFKNIETLMNRNESTFTGRTISKKVKVLYLYGDSGVGKSVYARYLFRDTPYDNLKYIGEFWHGVSGKDNPGALYDDFRDSHMSPSEFINFIDYTYHTMNIKCGSVINKYKYIIITSVFPPSQLWKNYQDKKNEDGIETSLQWMRRMKIINMEDYYKEHPEDLKKFLIELGEIDDPAKIEEEDEDDPFKGLNIKYNFNNNNIN